MISMSESVEQKDLDTLQFAEYNPRRISQHDYKALKNSMARFGDLSGVVKNIRTGKLVGGHQRVRAFMEAKGAKIKLTESYETPNTVGTMARGFVHLPAIDESFAYREVDWDEQTEMAANIAANRIQGEFDDDLLAQAMAAIEDPDMRLMTGHRQDEIDNLLQLSSAPEQETPPLKDDDKLVFRLTPEQRDTVERALNMEKSRRDMNYEAGDSNGAALFYICQMYLDNEDA